MQREMLSLLKINKPRDFFLRAFVPFIPRKKMAALIESSPG